MRAFVLTLFLSIESFSAELEIDADYDPHQHPNEASGKVEPQVIDIDIELQNIFKITQSGTVVARLMVTETWTEHRLRVKQGSLNQRKQVETAIWTPNGKFKNTEDIKAASVVNFVESNPDGDDTVVHLQELTLHMGCTFDYTWIPFDWQKWEFIYYDNFNSAFYMRFNPGKFKISDDVNMHEWEIIHDDYEAYELEEYGDTTTPAVKATIVIQRQTGFFVQFHFLPTILLVLLSYAAFFIDHTSLPARVNIGTVTILSAFVGIGSILKSIPIFSHSAWIIEFMFASVIFNIIAMLEYCVVAYMEINYAQHRQMMKNKGDESVRLITAPSFSDTQYIDPTKQNEVDTGSSPITTEELEEPENKFRLFIDKLKAIEPIKIDVYFRTIYIGTYSLWLLVFFTVPLGHKY